MRWLSVQTVLLLLLLMMMPKRKKMAACWPCCCCYDRRVLKIRDFDLRDPCDLPCHVADAFAFCRDGVIFWSPDPWSVNEIEKNVFAGGHENLGGFSTGIVADCVNCAGGFDPWNYAGFNPLNYAGFCPENLWNPADSACPDWNPGRSRHFS